MIKTKTTKMIDTSTTITITKTEIVELLRTDGLIPKNVSESEIEVYFTVPGGGDWSNMNADIDGESPVYITYKEREITES